MKNIDKVRLPSNGLLENTPEEVTVRSMTGLEISTLFSSFTEAAIDEIILNVTDNAVDVDLLCDEDKKFILHKTRTLSFGNELDQILRCPFCNHIHTYSIDYVNFETKFLQEDYINKTIEIEGLGKVKPRIPTKKIWGDINRYKEKINLPTTYNFILLQVARIDKIDNEKKSIGDLIDLLSTIPGKSLTDLAVELDNPFGLDTTYTITCINCGTDFTGGVGINADLFR